MTDHHLILEQPYTENRDPLDMDEARAAARRMARIRRDAEGDYRVRIEEAANAEVDYREALAVECVRLGVEENVATTAAQARAHKASDVKTKLRAYRIADGMAKAQKERLESLEGERSLLKSLIDYSARVAFLLLDDTTRPAGETHGRRTGT